MNIRFGDAPPPGRAADPSEAGRPQSSPSLVPFALSVSKGRTGHRARSGCGCPAAGHPLARCVFVGALLSCVVAHAAPMAPDFVEARVADASDRAYEETAIWLMDRARSSIVLSLYLLAPSDDARHPVNRLLRDLEEAAHRGVVVTVYLNTRLWDDDLRRWQAPAQARLTAAGVRVVPLEAARLLHDKLLIVDDRYVLEGSTNWTVPALKRNWESNTVMESPALAAIKLARLRDREHRGAAAPPPPGVVPDTLRVPAAWLAQGGALHRLVARADERAFDTLLLLLREAAAQEVSPSQDGLFVSLEGLGADLGLPKTWDASTVRRQVIKVLRKLADRDRILTVRFTHSEDAAVAWPVPDGAMLAMPAEALTPDRLARELSVDTYLRLLVHQGVVDLEALSLLALAARTGLKADRLADARARLRG